MKTVKRLNIIAEYVRKGCLTGYYPYWRLQFFDIDHSKLKETNLTQISNTIKKGYMEREIIKDNKNPDNNGWWKLVIEN